ncbi:MAG: trigger factor [Sedimentisphaeraceae bacterium JB056]
MAEETKNEIKNVVKVADAGPCRKKVSIEVPEDAIKEVVADQYKELRQEAVLPGFRKGRTPIRLLEKRFGKDINEQTKLKLLADATEKAIEENKLDTLGEPEINPEDHTLPESGSFSFEFEVNVRPEFDLPDFKAIKLEKPAIEVKDEEIEERLESLLNNFGEMADREEDAGIEEGDMAVADVVVTPEGEEAITVEDTDVSVKNDGFCGKVPVADLGDQLVGAKVGDEKSFSTEVPETFFNKDLAGKKCDVKVTVKKITFRKPAELNDELFDKLGLDDETALREKITDMLEDEKERAAQNEMGETIRKYLLDNTSFDLPEDVVAEQTDSLVKRQYSRLLMEGLEADELQKKTEELQTASQEEAKDNLKSFFIMDKVAQDLEVEVAPEEINGYIAQMAMYRQMRPEKMREQLLRDGSLTQFTMQAREQKCIEKIIEMNLGGDDAKEEKAEAKSEEKPKAAKKTTKKATKKAAPKKKAEEAEKTEE